MTVRSSSTAMLLCMLVALWPAHTARAQDALKSDRAAPPSWTKIQPLLDQASTLRVEYAADLGLAVLGQASSVVPQGARTEYLHSLFANAHTARYATPFTYAGHQAATSSQAMLGDNMRLPKHKLDELSIQTAVIEGLLKTAPEDAARLFANISLEPRRASCAEITVQDLSPYYRSLQKLLADPEIVAFNGESRVPFLMDRFREALTPEQIVSLLNVLARIDPGPDAGQAALQFAAHDLDQMTASNRELDALDTQLNIAMQSLQNYAGRRSLSLTTLAIAYRSFLVRSATTSRCDGDAELRKYTFVNFNFFRTRLNQGTQAIVPDIGVEDTRADGDALAATDVVISTYASLPPATRERLIDQGNRLLDPVSLFPPYAAPDPPTVTDEEASAALASMAHDVATDGCDLCLFQAHIRVFEALTARQPPGDAVRTLLLAEIQYLSANPMQDEDPPTYLAPLKALIETSRDGGEAAHAPGEHQRYSLPKPSSEPAAVREQLVNSSDPVIAAYMQFESLFRIRYTPQVWVVPTH